MAETLGPFELRAKCTETLHKEFHTLALASGREAADVLREIATDWVEREKHAHILRCKLLAGEGIVVEKKGTQ